MAGKARYFASASRGTEEMLAEELGEIQSGPVAPEYGGVAFGSRLEDAYRACLWSRVASRVFFPLSVFEAADPRALYAGVRAIRWSDHLGPGNTLAVHVTGARSPIGPSHFMALKTKDAIVDRIRDEQGARPDVDKQRPDVRVHVHVRDRRVTVSLDLAGRGLHRRGIGRQGAEAPLRENLAAALLRITGWPERAHGGEPLFDPLCGSGTLLVEAATMAIDAAPGLGRDRTGLEAWRGHDRELWGRLRTEAKERRAAARTRELRIAGSDGSRDVVALARETITRAGVDRFIRVGVRDLREAEPPWSEPGCVVTNPPYGARLGEAGVLGPLYELMGDVLKRRFPGWTAWILSGNRELDKRIGLRAASRHRVFNGPIECRWLEIPISDKPVETADGPGWRRTGEEARGLATKLAANIAEREVWAERAELDAYRVYDADVPVYNLAVDRYGGIVRVEEHPRPRKVAPATADRRLRDGLRVVAEAFGLDVADLVIPGRGGSERIVEIRERGLKYGADVAGFPDTGLRLEERGLRSWVRARAEGRDVLILFARTCSMTVAAAAGGARSTTSVERSAARLGWGRANLRINGLLDRRHRFAEADPFAVDRDRDEARRYDLIVVAPPSRIPDRDGLRGFEVRRDHARLISATARRLTPRGELVFAVAARGFELDERGLRGLSGRELTPEIAQPDFANRPRLTVWILRR